VAEAAQPALAGLVWAVLVLDLEVGRAGVEEEQLDLEVERSATAKKTASWTAPEASAEQSTSIAR